MTQGLNIKGSIHINWISCLITLSLLLLTSFLFRSEAFALSIEDEKKMGEEFLSNLRRNFELIEDDYANQYFNKLGNYLITPLETKPFPFRFHIIKSSDLNAFAAPGGHIFFFSGLIEALDSIDELTAVLCHEIGHVSARHLAQRIDQNKTIGLATLGGMLLGVLVGGEAGGALITGSMAGGIQAQLHFRARGFLSFFCWMDSRLSLSLAANLSQKTGEISGFARRSASLWILSIDSA